MRETGELIELNGSIYVRQRGGGGGIHNYANEQIQHIDSNVSQEILAKLRSSCEQFRNDAVVKLDSLRGVQGVVSVGVGNLTQAVGDKLTESAERNDNQEQVLDKFPTNAQKIIQELKLNREATLQTNNELVAMGQKLKGLGETWKVKL